MKISELSRFLRKYKKEVGDIEVYINHYQCPTSMEEYDISYDSNKKRLIICT